MAPPSKVQDEAEARRLLESGTTYREMVELYLSKYNILTSVSMWGNFAKRAGINPRLTTNNPHLPWTLREEHRFHPIAKNLRAAGRRDEGRPLDPKAERRLVKWIEGIRLAGAVAHYDPSTKEGFFLVPRRDGVDTGLIREPSQRSGS